MKSFHSKMMHCDVIAEREATRHSRMCAVATVHGLECCEWVEAQISLKGELKKCATQVLQRMPYECVCDLASGPLPTLVWSEPRRFGVCLIPEPVARDPRSQPKTRYQIPRQSEDFESVFCLRYSINVATFPKKSNDIMQPVCLRLTPSR